MEIIDIDISADGQSVRVEGKDIAGPDCKALTKALEEGLGVVAEQRLKPEYHQQRRVGVGRKVGR